MTASKTAHHRRASGTPASARAMLTAAKAAANRNHFSCCRSTGVARRNRTISETPASKINRNRSVSATSRASRCGCPHSLPRPSREPSEESNANAAERDDEAADPGDDDRALVPATPGAAPGRPAGRGTAVRRRRAGRGALIRRGRPAEPTLAQAGHDVGPPQTVAEGPHPVGEPQRTPQPAIGVRRQTASDERADRGARARNPRPADHGVRERRCHPREGDTQAVADDQERDRDPAQRPRKPRRRSPAPRHASTSSTGVLTGPAPRCAPPRGPAPRRRAR